MTASLLVEYFEELPQPQMGDDPDLLRAGIQQAVKKFRDSVREKYNEGTLIRLLNSPCNRTRRAAAMALGLLGTMQANPHLAAALHDDDVQVGELAAEAMWEIWFRSGTPEQNRQLVQALQLPDQLQIVAALDDLIREAPEMSEAFNQRAIMRYQRGEFDLAAEDCQKVLQMNPYHYGAASGLGQCYLRMNRPRAALRAFRHALSIHPHLDEVQQTIQGLEAALEGPAQDSD